MHELWALLNFLLPDIFENSEDFDAIFKTATEQDNILSQLHKASEDSLARVHLDIALR